MKKTLYGIFIITPIIIVTYFVSKYSANVPIWDEWRSAEYLVKYYQGTLQWLDFFAQNNEHRSAVSFFVNFLIALATHFNMTYEIYVSILLMTGTLLVLYLSFKKEFPNAGLVYFIPIPFILFSLRQYMNFLWGFENCVYFAILGVVASLYFIAYVKSNAGLLMAIIFGAVASYSFFCGLLIWPIGLYAIVASKRKKTDLIAWGLATLVIALTYFWNWVKPGQTSITYGISHMPDLIHYFFAVIGSPLASDTVSAAGIGFLMLVILAVICYLLARNKLIFTNNFFIFTLIFSLGFAIMNTVGRVSWGLDNAFMSRYTPFILLVPIAMYMLSLTFIVKSPYKETSSNFNYTIFGALSMLILAGLLIGNIQGYEELSGQNISGIPADNILKDQYYLLSYQYQPDENLLPLSPIPAYVRYWAPLMEKYNESVFYGSISPNEIPLSSMTTYGFIDNINGDQVTNNLMTNITIDSTSVNVSGWAFDAPDNATASAVFINLDGKYDIPTMYGMERPDVADYFKDQDLMDTGFWATFNSSLFTDGTHKLQLKIISHDKKELYESQPYTINVTRFAARLQ